MQSPSGLANGADPPSYSEPTTDVTEAASDGTASDATASDGTAAEGGVAVLPAGGSSAGVAQSVVGPILVDGDGLTLYAFLNDADGEATCFDDCAEAWPPAVVDGEPDIGELDATVFSTVEHPEGTMIKAGDWPLYRFAGDAAPGDINGQGVGGNWFVVTPSGKAISLVSSSETSLGAALVDAQGMTLYAFTNDADGEPTCVDDCATNWPPVLVGGAAAGEGESSVPASPAPDAAANELAVGDLDPALFSAVEHPTGAMLKIGEFPLYRFAGDTAPGDVNGQAVGDVWWAVAPDGTLIQP